MQGTPPDRIDEILLILRGHTTMLNRQSDALSILTEMSVRQAVGNPVPDEYLPTFIEDMSSLMSYIDYLKSSSCQTAARFWPVTPPKLKEGVLDGLTDPVRS